MDILQAGRAIRETAAGAGRPVTAVRAEISLAIRAGMSSADPDVRAAWARIPRAGDVPTPEEFVAYVAARAERKR